MVMFGFGEKDYHVLRHVGSSDEFEESYFVRINQEALTSHGGFTLGEIINFDGLEGSYKIRAAYEDSVFWLEKVQGLEPKIDGFPFDDLIENKPTFLNLKPNDYLLDGNGMVIGFFYPRRSEGWEVKIPIGAIISGSGMPGRVTPMVLEVYDSSFDLVSSEQGLVTYFVREVDYNILRSTRDLDDGD